MALKGWEGRRQLGRAEPAAPSSSTGAAIAVGEDGHAHLLTVEGSPRPLGPVCSPRCPTRSLEVGSGRRRSRATRALGEEWPARPGGSARRRRGEKGPASAREVSALAARSLGKSRSRSPRAATEREIRRGRRGLASVGESRGGSGTETQNKNPRESSLRAPSPRGGGGGGTEPAELFS